MKNSMIKYVVTIFFFWTHATLAQIAPLGSVWIQLEAQPDRPSALKSISRYMQDFSNVVGFDIGAGWFGVALGPYQAYTVDTIWQNLHSSGMIPVDSFTTTGTSYRSQIPLPILVPGEPTNLTTLPQTTTPVESVNRLDDASVESSKPIISADTSITTSEFRVTTSSTSAVEAEQNMTLAEKKYLQRALAWVGFYDSAIDGLYGSGTRGAMTSWQIANGYGDTGILTTLQRSELISDYKSLLAGLGFTKATQTQAGISLRMPNAILSAPTYEEPFVSFEANDGSVIKLILISQAGDKARLKALYEVIQTLSIIPKDGNRTLNNSNFTIEAFNSELHTTGFARLRDGHIKGALLVWPVGDDARRKRVADEVFNSFMTLPGVLAEATIFKNGLIPKNLLAGLDIRQPQFIQSGVFLNATGVVLTAARDFESCDLIELEDGTTARVIAQNTYLAVLEPLQDIAPAFVPEFQSLPPSVPRHISVGGYSYGGQLSMPTLTVGILQDVKNLAGERDIARLEINSLPGDVGGPLYDQNGAVIGVLLPNLKTTDRQLPSNVKFAATWGMIFPLLQQKNLSVKPAISSVLMDTIDLANIAKNTIALVKCWD